MEGMQMDRKKVVYFYHGRALCPKEKKQIPFIQCIKCEHHKGRGMLCSPTQNVECAYKGNRE